MSGVELSGVEMSGVEMSNPQNLYPKNFLTEKIVFTLRYRPTIFLMTFFEVSIS